MMRKEFKSALIALCLTIICFLPVLLVWRQGNEKYEIWFVGDSIIAGNFNGDSIPKYVEERTGIKTLNAGFGGMTMSEGLNCDKTNVYMSFNMVNISKAIRNRNLSFAKLNSQKNNSANVANWENNSEALSRADIDSCKIIFIEFGTNDYFAQIPLDDENDRYNVHTYGGALRTVLENVIVGMPKTKIVLIALPYNDISIDGFGLEDYVAKEIEIAKEYNVEVVNNFELSGINKDNYKEYLADGVHPNSEGILAMSKLIVDLIMEMKENL